jgi:predicted phosphodiesterase
LPAKVPVGAGGSYLDWKPHKITEGSRVLWLSDIHVPYHDSAALSTALRFGREKKCNHVLLAGDFVDFKAISRFQRDPDERDLYAEVLQCRKVLSVIRRAFPRAHITFMHGNHEDRLQNWLWANAPEIKDFPSIKIPAMLEFDKYRVTEVPPQRLVKIGKLVVLHGHELRGGGSGGVNPARSLFLRGGETAICGHWHRMSVHSEPSTLTRAHRTACWSVGCLCFLHPDWMPYNKWGHGCAVIEFDKTGFFRVDNREIIDGQIY